MGDGQAAVERAWSRLPPAAREQLERGSNAKELCLVSCLSTGRTLDLAREAGA